MFTSLFAFLGGSVFRMIWGEIAAWMTAKQEHAHEIERLKLQSEIDAAQHGRNLESIKVQADLNIKTVQVQAEADIGKLETEGWFDAVKQSMQPIGVAWVDAWNGSIRPFAATVVLSLWVATLYSQNWVMTDGDRDLMGVILGFFFASRELMKRGK